MRVGVLPPNLKLTDLVIDSVYPKSNHREVIEGAISFLVLEKLTGQLVVIRCIIIRYLAIQLWNAYPSERVEY